MGSSQTGQRFLPAETDFYEAVSFSVGTAAPWLLGEEVHSQKFVEAHEIAAAFLGQLFANLRIQVSACLCGVFERPVYFLRRTKIRATVSPRVNSTDVSQIQFWILWIH